MRRFYQWLFDRSQSRFSRIAACALIGSILFALASRRLKGADAPEWWTMSFLGGLMGLDAGLVLSLVHFARTPGKKSSLQAGAWIAAVALGLIGCIGMCVALIVFMDSMKRH